MVRKKGTATKKVFVYVTCASSVHTVYTKRSNHGGTQWKCHAFRTYYIRSCIGICDTWRLPLILFYKIHHYYFFFRLDRSRLGRERALYLTKLVGNARTTRSTMLLCVLIELPRRRKSYLRMSKYARTGEWQRQRGDKKHSE